jgi:cell wall-associated NlpC family hydrolase
VERFNRRRFIERLLLGGSGLLALRAATSAAQDETGDREAEDRRIFARVVAEAATNGYGTKPIGEVMGAVGLGFLGVPYVAHSLEGQSEERLVVNLRAFDCTTFMESVLALSRCIRSGQTTFEDYQRELQAIRYRGGIIERYESRLHYFTDWVQDNAVKGTVRDVTRECGGERDNRSISFMTAHVASYPQLSDTAALAAIRNIEHRLSASERSLLPKARVEAASDRLATGDIIGITTTLQGMDVSHVGIAVRSGGKVKFLHAPLSGAVVTLTASTLSDYLAKSDKQTGIIVARPVDPA